jgi:hypothetical protein
MALIATSVEQAALAEIETARKLIDRALSD